MAGLIFPGVLLLLFAMWGIFSSNRKFKKEFRLRGMSWDAANAAAAAGEGVLVIDTVYGPLRGLGHPAIWYLSHAEAAVEDLGEVLKSTARIVHCPKALRSFEALKKLLPLESLRGHGWDVEADLATAGQSK